MKTKLRVVPDRSIVVGDLGPLDPGGGGHVRSVCDQRFRVVDAHVTATFPQSRIEQIVRRIPVVGRLVEKLLRDRDAADRAWATAQVKIDHVTVGDHARSPSELDDLPIAAAGAEISVSVTNRSDRPLAVRVLIEGVRL